MIYGVVTPSRITKVVSSLNFMWPMEERLQCALGTMETKAQNHMGTSWEDDVDKGYEFLRVRGMGSRWEMTQMSKRNGITGANFVNRYNPVDKVVDAMHDWSTWVDERLSMRKWN